MAVDRKDSAARVTAQPGAVFVFAPE